MSAAYAKAAVAAQTANAIARAILVCLIERLSSAGVELRRDAASSVGDARAVDGYRIAPYVYCDRETTVLRQQAIRFSFAGRAPQPSGKWSAVGRRHSGRRSRTRQSCPCE